MYNHPQQTYLSCGIPQLDLLELSTHIYNISLIEACEETGEVCCHLAVGLSFVVVCRLLCIEALEAVINKHLYSYLAVTEFWAPLIAGLATRFVHVGR